MDDEPLVPDLVESIEEADALDDEVIEPSEVQVGTVHVTTEAGGDVGFVLRVIDGDDRLDVVMGMGMARRVLLAGLRVIDRDTPLAPQREAVLLRAPGGMGRVGIAAALGEVVGEMFGTGPVRPQDLRTHMVGEHGVSEATVASMSDDDLRAWHRAEHEEGAAPHG